MMRSGVLLFEALQQSTCEPLAGIAQKAVKELRYHLRHSSQWMLRLGGGTEESHARTQNALNTLWRFTDEMFLDDLLDIEASKNGVTVLPSSLKEQWNATVTSILRSSSLTIPVTGSFLLKGGREGRHSEHLGHLLSEMQIVARSYPDIQW
jgi:ring-1,2-phenylacetyl-CoA epoxidase subunit PaaC